MIGALHHLCPFNDFMTFGNLYYWVRFNYYHTSSATITNPQHEGLDRAYMKSRHYKRTHFQVMRFLDHLETPRTLEEIVYACWGLEFVHSYRRFGGSCEEHETYLYFKRVLEQISSMVLR